MAASIKEFLQGKWVTHALHPAVVHFPVGLWISAVFLDVMEYVFPIHRAAFAAAAFWGIAVGLLVTLVAIPTGLADWWDIKKEKPAYLLGLWHLWLNVGALAVFLANLVYRLSAGFKVDLISLGFSVIGAVLVGVSAYIGGRMVYDQGTGIARHSKEKWRQLAAAGGANLPAQES